MPPTPLITAPLWKVRYIMDLEVSAPTEEHAKLATLQEVSVSIQFASAIRQVALSAEPAADVDKRTFALQLDRKKKD